MRALQIRLIIHDRSILSHLPGVVEGLLDHAMMLKDPSMERAIGRLCHGLLMTTAVHRRMCGLDLSQQMDVVQQAPDLCEELRRCFANPEHGLVEIALPMLSSVAFAEGGIVSDIVAEALEAARSEETKGRVCAQFERDRSRERMILAEADAPQAACAADKQSIESFWGQAEAA
jgi:hypothetical protein